MVAEKIPLKNESVSNITVAFGVRNFYNIEEGFKSFYRILTPEGQVTILEFRMPENIVFKSVYKFYFKKVLPFVGGIILPGILVVLGIVWPYIDKSPILLEISCLLGFLNLIFSR